MDWARYLLPISLTDFAAGARVLDLGCGPGRHLRELRAQGCIAIGVDVRPLHDPRFVLARGEALPFREGAFDGIVSNVALSYMDEETTFAEIYRVLAPTGVCRVASHGAGYYLRILLRGRGLERLYALRTILNTWVYRLTGRRLIGDTLYQSRRRLGGTCSRFLGLPVFIYATIVPPSESSAKPVKHRVIGIDAKCSQP